MASTQLNVRIGNASRAAGDAALASIGFTPSRAVQALWAFASRNIDNKKALREMAALLESPSDADDPREARRAWAATGPQAYTRMLADMGIDPDAPPLAESDDELLFQAYIDRQAEKEARR